MVAVASSRPKPEASLSCSVPQTSFSPASPVRSQHALSVFDVKQGSRWSNRADPAADHWVRFEFLRKADNSRPQPDTDSQLYRISVPRLLHDGPPYLHGRRSDPRRRQLLQTPTLQACNCYHCQPQTMTVEVEKEKDAGFLEKRVAEEGNGDESRKAETTTWQKRLIFGGDFEG
jgi:hypothetical protein